MNECFPIVFGRMHFTYRCIDGCQVQVPSCVVALALSAIDFSCFFPLLFLINATRRVSCLVCTVSDGRTDVFSFVCRVSSRVNVRTLNGDFQLGRFVALE